MQFRTAGSLALAASLAFSSFASATVVFSDDFEGVGYNNGDSVGSHSPDVGTWTTVYSSSLQNSSPSPKSGTGGSFYASLIDRVVGNTGISGAAATANTTVYTTFDFYVTGNVSGNGLDYSMYDSSGNRGPTFLLKPNGSLAYYTESSGVYNTVANFNFATDAWQSASLVVNYATGAVSLTVGAQNANFTVGSPLSSNVRELYAINRNDSLSDVVGFDNIVISNTPVPEPAGLALVGLGALGLLRRKRKA